MLPNAVGGDCCEVLAGAANVRAVGKISRLWNTREEAVRRPRCCEGVRCRFLLGRRCRTRRAVQARGQAIRQFGVRRRRPRRDKGSRYPAVAERDVGPDIGRAGGTPRTVTRQSRRKGVVSIQSRVRRGTAETLARRICEPYLVQRRQVHGCRGRRCSCADRFSRAVHRAADGVSGQRPRRAVSQKRRCKSAGPILVSELAHGVIITRYRTNVHCLNLTDDSICSICLNSHSSCLEENHVSVQHDVLLALLPVPSLRLHRRLGARLLQLVERHHLRAHKPLLEVLDRGRRG